MTYSDLIKVGADELSAAQINEAALDARLLLEYICGTNYNTLLMEPDMEVSEQKERLYMSAIRKRAKHVPLQHITGTVGFMGLDFKVTKDVLVPRQDTEFLVEEALIYIEDGMSVLDVCTGSGCILLSIMNYKNDIKGVGLDISEAALNVARENTAIIASGLAPDLAQGFSPVFLQGDLYEALSGSNDLEIAGLETTTGSDGSFIGSSGSNFGSEVSGDLESTDNGVSESLADMKFDVIVSNPPYIQTSVIEGLMPEVRDHDPYIALDGGDDGLDFYKRIISDAGKHLRSYGHIFLEIGYDQGAQVKGLLEENGFTDIRVIKDYSGNDRVVTGTYTG